MADLQSQPSEHCQDISFFEHCQILGSYAHKDDDVLLLGKRTASQTIPAFDRNMSSLSYALSAHLRAHFKVLISTPEGF